MRPTRAVVDDAAISDNVAALVSLAAPARLSAVVKADGYGHGAVRAARAALAGGADFLAVALVEEALELRRAGLDAPILVLSQPPTGAVAAAVRSDVSVCIDTEAGAAAVAAAASVERPARVHVKVNTGMNRVGAHPDLAVDLAEGLSRLPDVHLEGVWTHFSVADQPDDPETGCQIERFDAVLARLETRGVRPEIVHASNSAGLLCHPRARYDMVRCGITIYGIPPAPTIDAPVRAAMTLVSAVSHVAALNPRDTVSYGRRWTASAPTTVVTVPIGYADGIRRDSGLAGAMVLIGGRRRPIVGTVTMDQLMVDVGDDPVEVGDEVVLIGRQGHEEITASDWAEHLGTIGYEVVCAIGRRVPRSRT